MTSGAATKTTQFQFLERLVETVATTNSQYAPLLKPGVTTCPMPFFGNPITAEFVTLGVNPSATEFNGGRWPTSGVSTARLQERLINYFTDAVVPAHRWFDGYENCLGVLGRSYREDTVHVDLSPRATKAMGSADRHLFVRMVAGDLTTFIETLKLCRSVKAGLMSGSVTGRYYFDEFLSRYLPASYKLRLRERLEVRARGATSLYELVGPELQMPVLFCSTSPSGDGGIRLRDEVKRNFMQLGRAGFQRL